MRKVKTRLIPLLSLLVLLCAVGCGEADLPENDGRLAHPKGVAPSKAEQVDYSKMAPDDLENSKIEDDTDDIFDDEGCLSAILMIYKISVYRDVKLESIKLLLTYCTQADGGLVWGVADATLKVLELSPDDFFDAAILHPQGFDSWLDIAQFGFIAEDKDELILLETRHRYVLKTLQSLQYKNRERQKLVEKTISKFKEIEVSLID